MGTTEKKPLPLEQETRNKLACLRVVRYTEYSVLARVLRDVEVYKKVKTQVLDRNTHYTSWSTGVIALRLTRGSLVRLPRHATEQRTRWCDGFPGDQFEEVVGKCRASSVVSLGDGESGYASRFHYRVGQRKRPHKFEVRGRVPRWCGFSRDYLLDLECAGGIHLFFTRAEAERWRI